MANADWYIGVCENEIRSQQIDPNAEFLPHMESDEQRFRVWRARCMLTAFAALGRAQEENTPPSQRRMYLTSALRNYTSAREYHGRLRSCAHSALSDTLMELQARIEEVLLLRDR